jgi:hypothetical protein
MHNSFLKSLKKFVIVPYTALHVSGTFVPIIRSFPLLYYIRSLRYRVPLLWLRVLAVLFHYSQQEHASRAAAHGTGGCECSTKWKAPDDGHKGSRNM